MLRGFFHHVPHRELIGVEAHADVLQIDDDRVDSLEHLVRRRPRLAEEAEHGQARAPIARASFSSASAATALRRTRSHSSGSSSTRRSYAWSFARSLSWPSFPSTDVATPRCVTGMPASAGTLNAGSRRQSGCRSTDDRKGSHGSRTH